MEDSSVRQVTSDNLVLIVIPESKAKRHKTSLWSRSYYTNHALIISQWAAARLNPRLCNGRNPAVAATAVVVLTAAAAAATGGGGRGAPQPQAPVPQPSPYGYAMGLAGAAAAAGLPAPNVAHPTAASAGGYPPGAACVGHNAPAFAGLFVCCFCPPRGSALLLVDDVGGGGGWRPGVQRISLFCGIVLMRPHLGSCHLKSTTVLFGDLVVVCLVVGTGAELMWNDGDSRGGGRGFLRGAMQSGAGGIVMTARPPVHRRPVHSPASSSPLLAPPCP
ncbi:unnamed protein product, partial [Taenia asiatica]|uniref:Uncharacterized protein n=1 Tax=Taenia asiatica TaxID=60517 RepID=A0A0R3VYK0_TAEAS